jgi:hypothetical protein
MVAKFLLLVAAVAAIAYASPINSDVTDFDKVAMMLDAAAEDKVAKSTDEMPAWETPTWMPRRTNSSVTGSATVTLTGPTGLTVASNQATAATGTYAKEYAFLAKTFINGLGMGVTYTSGDVTALAGISAYTNTYTFSSRRGTVSAQYSITTTLLTADQYNTKTTGTAANSAFASAATSAKNDDSSIGGTISATVTGSAANTSGVARVTVGFAAIFLALFAQLF